MAWTYVGTGALAEFNTTGGGTVDIPACAAGDLILLHCAGRSNTMDWAASGYSTIGALADNSGVASEILYKWATGSETSITVTNAVGTNGWSCHADVWRGGLGTGSPLNVAEPTPGEGNSLTMTAPTATSVNNGCLILRYFESSDDNTHDSHSEGTVRHSLDATTYADHSCSGSSLVQTSAGATGTATASQSVNGADTWIARTLVLTPLTSTSVNAGLASGTGSAHAASASVGGAPAPWSKVSTGAQAEFNTTGGGAVHINAGIAVGDLIILHCVGRNNGMDWAATGFSVLGAVNTNSGIADEILYKWATGSEGDTDVTVTCSVGTNGWSAHSEVWRGGLGSGSPLDVAEPTPGESNGTTMTAPTVTPVTNGCLVLRMFASGDDNTHGSFSEGTTAHSYDSVAYSAHACSASYFVQTTAAATGTATATQTVNGADLWMARTFALKPAAGGTPSNLIPTPVAIPVAVAPSWQVVLGALAEPEPVTIALSMLVATITGVSTTITLTPDPLVIAFELADAQAWHVWQPTVWTPSTTYSAGIAASAAPLWTGVVRALPLWDTTPAGDSGKSYANDGTVTAYTGSATVGTETPGAPLFLYALLDRTTASNLIFDLGSFTPAVAGSVFLELKPLTLVIDGAALWGTADNFEGRTDQLGLLYNDALRVGVTEASTASIEVNQWQSLLFCWDQNANVSHVYLDGVMVLDHTGLGALPAAATLNVGMRSGSTAYPNARVAAIYVWDRMVTATEAALLAQDPWVMFRPISNLTPDPVAIPLAIPAPSGLPVNAVTVKLAY